MSLLLKPWRLDSSCVAWWDRWHSPLLRRSVMGEHDHMPSGVSLHRTDHSHVNDGTFA